MFLYWYEILRVPWLKDLWAFLISLKVSQEYETATKVEKFPVITWNTLTHYGLATPHGDTDLGQHWFR